jgi:glutamate synthase domain-containing protein 3
VRNGLRAGIAVQTDGQMKTGRDVVIAALLGADEVGFSTAPLIATGCIMMRVCHLNTCPVGIATQDPELRRRFAGTPEHVVRYLFHVAEEVRGLMATLGVPRFEELIGRCDLLHVQDGVDHWKARTVDLGDLLVSADPASSPEVARRRIRAPDRGLEGALDHELIEAARPALEDGRPVRLERGVRNVHRAVGGLLSNALVRAHGGQGLAEGAIEVSFDGCAGQSFGAWLAPGISFTLAGEANDYVGKGLSGGVLALVPPPGAASRAEDDVIAGNKVLYGATSGRAFFRGRAGERFAVRNSGAHAVVEGVGDHGCEYMTGGRVVVLGPTGRDFAAGMSGGVAYVLDEDGGFAARCNLDLVVFDALDEHDMGELRALVAEHAARTGSPVAERMLAGWEAAVGRIVKVIPTAYKAALAHRAERAARGEREEVPA